MNRIGITTLMLFLLAPFQQKPEAPSQAPMPIQSRAEATDFRETSRFDDVMKFLDAVAQQSKQVRVTSFGKSAEGRSLPLVILADPAVDQPAPAIRSKKLRVFIMANIHAGEVEGKEASLHLIREIAFGPLNPLLKDLVILFAPIYNADGNERISNSNRTNQNGPVGGVGIRENAAGMDLNRDYMKLETPEANALVGQAFNRWDPHVIVDLHTTNGSYHGYALTYAPALNPNGDERLMRMTREVLLPAIRKQMKEQHKYETHSYGNFIDENHPEKGWQTFDHRPRIGNNYIGLRNRIAILSEAYAYIDFKSRVDVTRKFVQSILEYCAGHASELAQAVAAADQRMRLGSREVPKQLGIKFALRPLPDPVEILGNEVIAENEKFRRTDRIVTYRTREFSIFEATERERFPRTYYIGSDQAALVEKLRAHGVKVDRIAQTWRVAVELFHVHGSSRSSQAFQNHFEARVTGAWHPEVVTLPAGSFKVRTAQPLGRLAFYLLDPESDDGLLNWNFFDPVITEIPAYYPVYRSPD